MTDQEQKTLQRLSDLKSDQRNNVLMNATVQDTVSKILGSVETPEIKLRVKHIGIVDKMDNNDISAQKDVRNKGRVWSSELRADLELIDKATNKVLDKVDNIKVATIPKITDRGTYLIGGNEYQFTKQARLKPGIYTKTQANGEISSFFNVDKTVDFDRGFNNNFKLTFEPERKVFMMQYGSKNIPLINAAKALGVTREELVDKWGKDVYDANDKAYGKHEVRDQVKLYGVVFGKLPTASLGLEPMKAEIRGRLFKTALDPDVTKITLGKPHKEVNKEALLDAARKIIDIHRGDVEDDDRESLIFKSFHDAEDHVREQLVKKADRIIGNIRFRLGKDKKINKAISSQTFDPFITGTITTSQLSNPPTQTNLMSIIGDSTKMTVMGEGGIGSANAITNDARQISNSEVGFIDPLHTPEGGAIGVTVHTTMNSVKIGNDLYSKFRKPDGEKVILRPIDAHDKIVAFPDQFDISDGKPKARSKMVKAVHLGKMVEVPASKVDYIVSNSHNMFDSSVNMIPFLDSIQGNRGLTASKMQEQALPLNEPDHPLFKIVDEQGHNIGQNLASSVGVPHAKADGEVSKVTDNQIIVKDDKGVEHSHPLYNNFSLNAESFLHNKSNVKVGDRVKKGSILADNNFTKDGSFAIGANLKVAYMPYKGYNYEDSTIVSETAAKKLTSVHMYDLKTKRSAKGVFSASKLRAYYPEELKTVNHQKLDDDGVVRVGQRLERGDVAIAHLEKKAPTADDLAMGRLDKQRKRDMSNESVMWENDHVGIVTGVQKHGNSVVVNVKTEEPLKVADKLSGLHGNKHIVSKIVPDEEMPYSAETGERVHITMNPIGVSNRINTSQLLESAAGKIAQKTGTPYVVQNFAPVDNTRRVLADLQANGLSDKEVLVDPENGKPFLNPVMTGISHIMKLEHKVDHKFSARYKEGYDSNEQPVTGGHTGAKNLGRMEMAALLARGADENLKEMYNIKGQRNDEYWRAMETGQSLPPPKRAFVWDKLLASMHGAGINVEQKGKALQLKPMTDKDIEAMSSGKLPDPTSTYRKKDMAPIKGGLFDPQLAGGIHGDNFTHFDLPEKILNPITASAAATLLDMPLTQLEAIIDGKNFVDKTTGKVVPPGTANAFSGGPAVELMLSRIKPDEAMKEYTAAAETTKNPTMLNKYNKKLRYLRSLKENGSKPTDYMISKVLVTPSKFRPMFSMGTENTVIMSDINELYQQAGHTANAFKELKGTLNQTIKDEDVHDLHLAEVRGAMYHDIKAVAGLQDPTSFIHRSKDKKGFISQIDGGKKQTKEGFFQDKVMEKRQDLVGRSTIILNPELNGDEIGIPKEMANQIFRPFIMKKMVSWGYQPLEAMKQIKDETGVFKRAREVVADERLVIANRAPSLHRWNMIAFKPKLIEGRSIQMPSVVIARNMGADIDGDTVQLHTPISQKALAEAERMKPSSSMLKTGYDSVLNMPAMDMIVGSWLASKGKGGTETNLKFKSIDEARGQFKDNKFNYADSVTIGNVKAPFGVHEINSVIPDEHKKWNVDLSSNNVESLLRDVTKSHGGKTALTIADKIKDVGSNYVTRFGFTLGLSDTVSDLDIRDNVLAEAEKNTDKKSVQSIVENYSKAKSKAEKMLSDKHGENTMLGIGIKSGGSKGVGNTASIVMMPGILTDAYQRPIAVPVTRSYSEGLDNFGYWAAAHGARGGNIQKSVSSWKPGAMTKDLINSIYSTRIESEDPTDTEGLEYDISDKKAISNRHLAQDVKGAGGKIIARRNDLITSDVINSLTRAGVSKVNVQSPITDPTPGDGFSSWSYGTDYDGKRHNRGDHIGVMAAHTMTEPSVNMAMKAFHTGGTFDVKRKSTGSTFDILDRALKFNKTPPDKATVAALDGKVKSISKSSIGGYDVIVGDKDNEEVHYVDSGRDLTVKVGDVVKRGELLSNGTPNPHDILKHRGMRETQKYLVNAISEINEGKLDKRDIETVVRGITNTTRVMRPGSGPFVAGDIAPLTTVEWFNKNNIRDADVTDVLGDRLSQDAGRYKAGDEIDHRVITDLQKHGLKRVKVSKDPIVHEPFLTAAGIQEKLRVSEDWMARLAHSKLKQLLEEGTTMGYKTHLGEGAHPIPNYAIPQVKPIPDR